MSNRSKNTRHYPKQAMVGKWRRGAARGFAGNSQLFRLWIRQSIFRLASPVKHNLEKTGGAPCPIPSPLCSTEARGQHTPY
jgi:hypothetical protein